MRICGVDLKSSDAIFVVVEAVDNGLNVVDCKPKKVNLADTTSAKSVVLFKSVIDSFLRTNSIDKLAIKRRTESGEFASGATTFKIEGLLQLADVPSVELIHPATIAAAKKRHPINLPAGLHKYQHDAFWAAFTLANSDMR